MKRTALIFCLFGLAVMNLFSQQNVSSDDTTVIIAGKFIDVRNESIIDNQAIVVIGEYINKTGPKNIILSELPENVKLINLESATVLPGLIDCHVHLDKESGNYYRDLVTKTPVDYAIESTVFARKTLEAGFTSCRDLGSYDNFIDVALKKAINNGTIVGPRLQVAGLFIGSTGGHADLLNVSPYIKLNQFSGVADGVDEIRKMVRFNIKNGADVIKIMLNGTLLQTDLSSDECQYSQEELNMCVEEAKRWGVNVAAHVHSSKIIKKAIVAGVLSIEHASNLDDECIKLAKEHGTFIVPTIYWIQYLIEQSKQIGFSSSVLEKLESRFKLQEINFKRMIKGGVKIAYGTDATIIPHGWNAKQFSLMVEWGMDPMKAIQTSTINASELLGWADKVGVIEPGHYADIIAVKENPVDNIKILEQVDFVMKDGKVIKNNF